MTDSAVSAALAALEAHRLEIGSRRIADLFAQDPGRAQRFRARLDDLTFDYSKHGITEATLAHLFSLLRAAHFEARRDALMRGEAVNLTEKRAAMHMALRDFTGGPALVEGRDVTQDVQAERAKMLAFAAQVRDGALRGATGERIADVVNIGIGGSDLGPAMAARALSPFRGEGPRMHFVSNVDGAYIADTLAGLDGEGHIVQRRRSGIGVAEGDFTKLDATFQFIARHKLRIVRMLARRRHKLLQGFVTGQRLVHASKQLRKLR